MLDNSFCCLRSLIFGAKNLNRILKGAMDVYQVLWFGGGATCTLMYNMLCILVAVHYL